MVFLTRIEQPDGDPHSTQAPTDTSWCTAVRALREVYDGPIELAHRFRHRCPPLCVWELIGDVHSRIEVRTGLIMFSSRLDMGP